MKRIVAFSSPSSPVIQPTISCSPPLAQVQALESANSLFTRGSADADSRTGALIKLDALLSTVDDRSPSQSADGLLLGIIGAASRSVLAPPLFDAGETTRWLSALTTIANTAGRLSTLLRGSASPAAPSHSGVPSAADVDAAAEAAVSAVIAALRGESEHELLHVTAVRVLYACLRALHRAECSAGGGVSLLAADEVARYFQFDSAVARALAAHPGAVEAIVGTLLRRPDRSTFRGEVQACLSCVA